MPAVRLMRLPQFTLRIAHDGGRAESYTLMLFKLTCGTLAGNAGHLFSVGEFRKRQRVWALGTWYLDHVAMPPSTPHQSICQPFTGVPTLPKKPFPILTSLKTTCGPLPLALT